MFSKMHIFSNYSYKCSILFSFVEVYNSGIPFLKEGHCTKFLGFHEAFDRKKTEWNLIQTGLIFGRFTHI